MKTDLSASLHGMFDTTQAQEMESELLGEGSHDAAEAFRAITSMVVE